MSIESESVQDVAHEAYEQSLFADMADRIVALSAQIEELKQEKEVPIDIREDVEDIIIELRETADYDELTGLLRRTPFEELVTENCFGGERKGDQDRTHSLILLDIDNFKLVNDNHGHVEGDTCLKHVGQAIEKGLLRPNDYGCRWGGEEFAVLLCDTNASGAAEVAERIQTEVNQKIPGQYTNKPLGNLGVTIGIVTFSHGDSFEQIFKMADDAMLSAKSVPGKNQIFFWDKNRFADPT